MPKPAVSCVMEVGPPSQRRETRRKRISSPSAANSGAECTNSPFVLQLLLGKVFLHERHYDIPALLVGLECLRAARQWDPIEAGFCDRKHHTFGHCLQG